ncbi:MAG: hypothetical protein MJ089_03590 [Ruminococcus sp.]|nr:hypothetical protein [Ruminococcus sp.]
MAKDMLNAIFNAENECKKRESEAKAQAQLKQEKAHNDAVELVRSAKLEAENNAQKLYKAVESENQKELEHAKRDAEKRCNVLSNTAEKSRSKVIKNVVAMLTD